MHQFIIVRWSMLIVLILIGVVMPKYTHTEDAICVMVFSFMVGFICSLAVFDVGDSYATKVSYDIAVQGWR